MVDYYAWLGPMIRLLPAEAAHDLAVWALRTGLVPGGAAVHDARLHSRVFGLDFANPVGLAAGFDKDARVIGPMLRQGFGFVEVGTVTPRPQPGNPKPRMFRLAEDGAVINRLGFNNAGMDTALSHLQRFFEQRGRGKAPAGVIGVNIGKNKQTSAEDTIDDYVQVAQRLAPVADYMVINVSSPNTPGLRALQSADALAELLDGVAEALAQADRAPPLLLKIAPDLTDSDERDIAEVLQGRDRVAGLIVSNTTIERPDSLRGQRRGEGGGLSGAPLMAPSTALLARMYALTQGRLPLIGVGGIASADDAYAKIRAGASLVQVYTGLIYQGTALVERINRGLLELLARDGFANVADAVGSQPATA